MLIEGLYIYKLLNCMIISNFQNKHESCIITNRLDWLGRWSCIRISTKLDKLYWRQRTQRSQKFHFSYKYWYVGMCNIKTCFVQIIFQVFAEFTFYLNIFIYVRSNFESATSIFTRWLIVYWNSLKLFNNIPYLEYLQNG